MTLMVIGDFVTPEMVTLVKAKYGLYPAAALPERRHINVATPQTLRIIRANGVGKFPDDKQYLSMGYLLPPPSSGDFQALALLSEFLGGRENSAITTLFKQEQYKDMADSIESSIEFNRDFFHLANIGRASHARQCGARGGTG